MPQLRGVTVHVTDTSGNALTEWGTRYLRHGQKVFTFVKSTTDAPFQITLQPQIPFSYSENDPLDHHTSPPSFEDEMLQEHARQGVLGKKNDILQHPRSGRNPNLVGRIHRRSTSEDTSFKGSQAHTSQNVDSRSSPVRSLSPYEPPPPKFSLLATLYLDGRRVPERQLVLYLDPDDVDFAWPDGKHTFKNRWVSCEDGAMKEVVWVFKDRAIETAFQKMVINTTEQDDDLLTESLEGIRTSEEILPEEKNKCGQIVVKISRVVLWSKWNNRNYRSRHREGIVDEVDMGGLQSGVTHAAGFVHKATRAPGSMNVVEYSPYDAREGAIAEFQFFYRSQEQLEKYDLPGFPKTHRSPVEHYRPLDYRLANLTPLSKCRPSQSKLKELNDEAGEAKESPVKRVLENSNSIRKESEDDDGYDPETFNQAKVVTSSEEHSNEEIEAAANPQVPFKDPVAKMSSKDTAASKISSTATEEALKIAEHLASSNLQTNALSVQSVESNHRSSTSITDSVTSPTSLTAEPPSSPLSSTSLTASKIAILNPASYRLHSQGSDVDADGDADDEHDELATESDLETHADDVGESGFAANLDEEDEKQRGLRSRLHGIGLGKRTRDQVDHGSGDDEDWETYEGNKENEGGGERALEGDGQGKEERTEKRLRLEG